MLIALRSSSEDAEQFFTDVAVRLMGKDMIKNPFYGYVGKIGNVYYLRLSPLYPNPIIFAGLALLAVEGIRMLTSSSLMTWWLLLPGLLGAASLAWSSPFYFFMLGIALKKKGIVWTRLSSEELVEVMQNRAVGSLQVLARSEEEV